MNIFQKIKLKISVHIEVYFSMINRLVTYFQSVSTTPNEAPNRSTISC